jgi:hypothetical protein
MQRRYVSGGLLMGLAFIVAVPMSACGSGNSAPGFAPPDGGGSGSGSGGGSGSSSGSLTGDGGNLVGDGSSTVPCGGVHCSSDLRGLVDCNGNVVMQCPANEGCSGMSCVAACQSAIDNKSSLGCEYYAVIPDSMGGLGGIAGGCFAVYVANTWDTPVTLTVDYGGMALDPSKFAYIPTGAGQNIQYAPIANGQIPAGEVAILFLNAVPGATDLIGSLDCPKSVTPAITSKDAATHNTGLGSAFHISATAPVAAFDIYPFGGGQTAATSATLLLPTSAWDTNYVVVSAFGPGLVLEDLPVLTMVAQQDNTQIVINPTNNIIAGTGVAAATKGTSATYTINKGQLINFTQSNPLDGSIVQSSAPIGMWGGKTALGIQSCCDDSAHQQIPPVHALGSEYVGVRYRNRYAGTEEFPPWRIIGAANGTVLKWDPAPPAGAPTTLSLGQVTEFTSNGPWVVSSQDANHPFYVSAHMTGAEQFDPGYDDGGMTSAPGDGRGDAEFVNVVASDEFLSSYVFFTDPTYPETNLVFVRTRGPNGFADVTLDCAGTLTGWQPIGSSGKYEYTRFDLVTGNFQGTGSCNNGRHEALSKLPFGLTVWGWGSAATGEQGMGFYTQYVSYAYPGGAGVAPINQVVIPPGVQ